MYKELFVKETTRHFCYEKVFLEGNLIEVITENRNENGTHIHKHVCKFEHHFKLQIKNVSTIILFN